MYVLTLRAEIHVPSASSLKAKRSVLLSMVRHLDQRPGVAAAEVDHLDSWQRAAIGVAVVGNTVQHVEQTMDAIERYVWSRPEIDVLDLTRSWWEE